MKKMFISLGFSTALLLGACGSSQDVDSSSIIEPYNTPAISVTPTEISEISPSASNAQVTEILETPTAVAQSLANTQILESPVTPIAVVQPNPSVLDSSADSVPGDLKTVFEVVSGMNDALGKGYSHHSILKMNMTISFDDYLEDMPLMMEGDVQNSRNYKGFTSFEEDSQIKIIDLVVIDQEIFARYPSARYWVQFPEDQFLVTPISISDLVKQDLTEFELIGIENSGGLLSDHISTKFESTILGGLLPVLKNSTGTLNLDIWVESDSSYISRILIEGLAVGGPGVKGPNGEDISIKVDIEMSSWDFGKLVKLSKPDLPGTPEAMIWDTAPKITLKEGRDYFATIEIFEGGEMKIDLLEELAPVTVNNFIFLSEQGYYDWVTFHRVIPDFMAQGGDPSGTGRGGPGYYIDNEFHPDARHDSAGVVSMANAGLLPDGQGTNGSQFFITFIETPVLDGMNPDGTMKDCSQGSCHSVFGKVVEGIDVLGSIVPRDPATANLPGDVIRTIRITSVPK